MANLIQLLLIEDSKIPKAVCLNIKLPLEVTCQDILYFPCIGLAIIKSEKF